MKGLVISGGGAKGAFAGGIAEYLMSVKRKEYDIFVGSSTGSLLVPFLAAGDLELAKDVYTNVTNKEIFKISPFNFKKVNGAYQTRINHLNSIRMFLKGQTTFGDSSNLRKLIGRRFSKKIYNFIRNGSKDVILTVANFTKLTKEYKSIHDHDYEDFCDWMWASANFVPFMSLMHKEGCDYADGGFGDYLPVYKALEAGATKVDAIYLSQEHPNVARPIIKTPFDTVLRVLDYLMTRIGEDDVIIGSLNSSLRDEVEVNTYFLDRDLTDNSLVFDPEMMKQWWKEGIEYGRTHKPKQF